MKNVLLFLACFLSIAFLQSNNYIFQKKSAFDPVSLKKRYGIGCSPDLASINFRDKANEIPLLDGWGKYRMPVTSTNDSAYIYFQQGINMYYSFHIIEAMASFEKALRFDERFAMGYWGKALAAGPNINDVGYSASPDAIESVRKAKSFYTNVTPVEKALVNAMEVRYSADTSQSRERLNQLYADAMKKVHKDFPNSADAAALYADALMIQHPWDLYDRFYNPKPWTPEIVAVLERLVKRFPENPGANHYYIHAIEGSKTPQKAIEVANRLGVFMPKVSHLVHMPSHIYIRSGQYEKGMAANTNAVNGYYDYASKFPLVSTNTFLYVVHNIHMQAACANLDGQYEQALKFSFDTQKNVDSTWTTDPGYWGMYSQYMYVTPYFTWVRFGKWDEILKAPAIDEAKVFASGMQHWAKGIAYARKQQTDAANNELQKLQALKSHPLLKESPSAFNPGIRAVEVAEQILQGDIAEEKNMPDEAIAHLQDAVGKEDAMLYNEPRDWLLPARHYLGQALIKANRHREAEKIFREDLLINPNNGWSLTGLETALLKQNKTTEAATVKQQSKKALARTDSRIISSVF